MLSFTRGQDINPDQSNYHYYNAFAYMTGRLDRDVAPGQLMHSYFSPFAYLPFYAMVRHLPPPWVGMGLGALHGLNLWLVFVIARLLARPLPPSARLPVVLAAVAISAASPMAISEFGTTIVDVLTSLPVLAGVAVLLAAEATAPPARRIGAVLLAGGLVGAATSLKLTNAAFAVGLAAASLAGWTGWRQRATAVAATGLGGALGVAAIGGSWYWRLWRDFGNPVFPYFNTVFRSPQFPIRPVYDPHYLPQDLLQALGYPFRWAMLQETTSESAFRDIRFVLLIGLGAFVLGQRLLRRGPGPGSTTPAGRRLIAFIAVAFAAWEYEWSIQRYLVPLELLLGPAILVLLHWTGVFAAVRGRALIAGAVVLAGACLATVHAAEWGHLGWRKTWYEVNVPQATGSDPVYFLDGNGLSYVIPALQPAAVAIDVIAYEDIASWGDTVFLRRIRALLAQDRPHWSISWAPLSDDFRTLIARYGLKQVGPCTTTRGRPVPLIWCPLVRSAADP